MKKVVLKPRPVGDAPPPPPPPPLVEAAPPTPPAPPVEEPFAASLPVTPPPEPEVAIPTDFEGWMQFAMNARPPRGQLAHAQFFATLAQNMALKEIADELAAFNEFVGAYDEAGEDGEEAAPLRLSDAISEGLLNAMSTIGLEQVLANAKSKA